MHGAESFQCVSCHSLSRRKKYSLKKAVENKVLDAAGHDYHQGDDILFDKSSGTYEVKPEIKPAELKAALKDGKILPSDIKVDDPSIGTKVNIMEAMSKGLISRSTGEYTGGSKDMYRDELEQEVMSVEKDTMKGGTIHARIVESGVITTRISSFAVEVP